VKLSASIRWEVIDSSIALITICRPDQRNAIDESVIDGLRHAWRLLEADDALRVGILTGEGDEALCAGIDLKMAARQGLRVPPRGWLPILGDSEHLSKPTIAAVNGVAYAGGSLLAQMCDLCIAADHARFAITEAKLGRGMPWAAPLARMLPQRVMMELLLTGQPMTASRALALGFVNDVVPSVALRDRALAMAKDIASNAPLTVKAARELVYLSGEMGRTAALRVARQLFEPVYLSADAQEGPRAFAEKRPPVWRGE
jgi:enoyl-CoA hydratase/carnithine racemase